MTTSNATVFHQDIIGFFFNYFSNFLFYEPRELFNECAYYHNHRKYGLSTVIFLPLMKIDNDQWEMTGKKIQIVLKKTRLKSIPYPVELKDTLITSNYHDRLRERIGVLQELIDEIHPCQHCGTSLMPRTCRTNDLKRTKFVSLQCPSCYKFTSTTFGVGLKTRLHRNLKKTRTH